MDLTLNTVMRVSSPTVKLTSQGISLLQKLREKKIGSQRNLERNTNFSQALISGWKTGKFNPTLSKFEYYLKYLGVDSNSFINNKSFVKTLIKIHNTIPPEFLNQNLDTNRAYVFGVVGPGDGSVSEKLVRLGAKDLDFIKVFKKAIEKSFGIKAKLHWDNCYKIWHVIVCSKDLANYFRSLNVSFEEENWRVPQFIKTSNKDIKIAYLKGVFDSQGGVNFVSNKTRNINLRSYNSRGLIEIQSLLENIGIKSSLLDKNRRLYIFGRDNMKKFQESINFSIKRRRDKLKQLFKSYKRRTK